MKLLRTAKKRLTAAIQLALIICMLSVGAYANSAVPGKVLAATDSVVRIIADYGDEYATGSGFVISTGGNATLIATNYHVVEDSPLSISIWISDSDKVSASIFDSEPQRDLCILKTAYAVNLPPLDISDKIIKQGAAVYAIGYPSAADVLSDVEAHAKEDATITNGIVSAIRKAKAVEYGPAVELLQINAAINSGNSGGPLLNSAGKVVGINTYSVYDSQGIYGAISSGELIDFLLRSDKINYQLGNNSIILVIALAALAGVVLIIGLLLAGKARKKRQGNTKAISAKGVSLGDYIALRPRKMTPDEAVSLLMPVALKLNELHNSGIAHLEVSPETIVIRKGTAQLLDKTGKESNCYSTGFAAPEIYQGINAGNLSDIYSFCAVLGYVVTGMQPRHAMARTMETVEFDDQQAELIPFLEIVDVGMSLYAQYRFQNMMELIYRLTPYNTGIKTEMPAPEKPREKAATERTERPRKKKAVAVVLPVLLILLVVGTHFGCYYLAAVNAHNGNYSLADKLLLPRSIVALYDENLPKYIDAGLFYEARAFKAAKDAFDRLGSYRDADVKAKEARYCFAGQLADEGEYDRAIAMYEILAEAKYKDSSEKVRETSYRKAVYTYYELGNFVEAYEQLSSILDYAAAKSLQDEIKPQIYIEGQNAYQKNQLHTAERLFSCISPYKESKKYMTLIEAKRYASDYRDYVVLRPTFYQDDDTLSQSQRYNMLLDIFYFEDAADILLSKSELAKQFLTGEWRSNDGRYYFTMEQDGHTSFNMPWFEYGDYYMIEDYMIEDGTYYHYKDGNKSSKRALFDFTAITPDSIEVYCYKDGSVITLYRQ